MSGCSIFSAGGPRAAQRPPGSHLESMLGPCWPHFGTVSVNFRLKWIPSQVCWITSCAPFFLHVRLALESNFPFHLVSSRAARGIEHKTLERKSTQNVEPSTISPSQTCRYLRSAPLRPQLGGRFRGAAPVRYINDLAVQHQPALS